MKKLLVLLCVVALLVVGLAACVTDEPAATTEPESETVTTETEEDTEPETGDVQTETDEPLTDTEAPDTENPDTENPVTGETTSGRTSRTRATTKTLPKITTTVEKTVPSNQRTLAKDKVVDMDGYKFKYSSSWLAGDITNKTLFAQNLQKRAEEVEEEYNCSINLTATSIYAQPSALKSYVTAQKNPADVIEGMVGDMLYPDIGAGYLKSWDDIEGSPINYSDARWVDSYTELSRYPLSGKVYGVQFFRPAEVRSCVVFNKTLLKQNGKDPDALYAAVTAKKWNFDMLREYALACTKDTNSDGKTDTWGITGAYYYLVDGFMWANDGKIVDVINGKVTATMSSAKTIEGISYIAKLVNEDKVVYYPESVFSVDTWSTLNDYDPIAEFLKGNIAFLVNHSWVINQQVKPKAKFDFGMVPLPMGPSAKDYCSPSAEARVCMCLTTNKNALKSAIILNAIARPLDDVVDYWDQVQDEYFQKNDTQSVEMYKLCLDKANCDLGYGVSALTASFNHAVARCVMWGDGTASANLQALEGNYDAEIAAVYSFIG